MTDADKGKDAETKVQNYLQDRSDKFAAFDYERRYDAHSAKGRAQRQTFDFAIYTPTWHGGIEVKEVKHDFRLPHGNFELHQVAKLRKRALAGGRCLVLVYHSTTELWRPVGWEFFIKREGGSWDLRAFATHPSVQNALWNFIQCGT